VGIEALSRGVGECHFVEMSPWVVGNCLMPNLETCELESAAVVHTGVRAWPACAPTGGGKQQQQGAGVHACQHLRQCGATSQGADQCTPAARLLRLPALACCRRRRTSCGGRQRSPALLEGLLTSCQVSDPPFCWPRACCSTGSRWRRRLPGCHHHNCCCSSLLTHLFSPAHLSVSAAAVCPPYELVDYNELYDLLDTSPLLHEVHKPSAF
jgi:hypothetical protein